MSNIIDKIQVSGVTYDIQGSGGGGITVDPTLDSGSTNPVANSAITTALDAKVNVADNAVSTKSIMYAYDKGDTAWKYPYNQGLRINQFFVKYTQSFENSNVPAWNNPMYITNDGSTTSQIFLRVNASNYQITSVASTSGDFTYALEGGRVNITLPDGYYISSFAQKYNFQIIYPKYVIYGGQSAQALQNTENVLNDIYSEMPKRWITDGSISCDSNYLYSYLYDNNSNDNTSMMPLGTSIKGEGNRLDVYFNGQTIHQKILNTGNGNYCNVPDRPAWNYTDDLKEITIHFNSGYTGSNTSYTIQVQTVEPNFSTHTDNLYYDVANHTLDASSAIYVTAATDGDDYTYLIKPRQEYSSYKIAIIRENNWCNICGIDNQRKEEYIITGVTTPSYSYQAQEIIDDLYSKVGGGKAIEGGRGIRITTGETADTVSFNLPISAGTGSNSIAEGYNAQANGSNSHAEGISTTASGSSSHAEGNNTTANGGQSHAEGYYTTASGNYSHAEGYYTIASGISSHAEGFYTKASGNQSHAEGNNTTASGYCSHSEGKNTIANNQSEHASGQFNVSSSASTTFGDSGNTLFSVGNGTADNARHNAFEIRQNGDIYLSSGGTDIKLQDHLGGGGSVTVDTELDSGSTNPVQNKVIYNKIDEVEQVTAAGLNALNESLSGKQDTLSAGTNITISGNVISAEGGGLTEDDELLLATALTDLNDRKIDVSEVKSNYQRKGDYVTTSALNTKLAEYETALDEQNVEEVTAYALNDLNNKFGGLSLVKITESEYEALTTKDENTLYIVVADPS